MVELEGYRNLGVAAYCTRDDPWLYQAHRRIFDAYPGAKVEYASVPAGGSC